MTARMMMFLGVLLMIGGSFLLWRWYAVLFWLSFLAGYLQRGAPYALLFFLPDEIHGDDDSVKLADESNEAEEPKW